MYYPMPNSPIADYPEQLVPATRRVVRILGNRLPDQQIQEIISCPYATEPDAVTIRHVAKRLYDMFSASKKTAFRLDAATLREEVIQLDWHRENSFYYDNVLTMECRSLVPVPIETSDLWPLLAPIIRYKEFGFQFRHGPALQAGLLLIIARGMITETPAARHHLDYILQTLIDSPPGWLLDELIFFRKRMERAEAEDGN